MPITEQGSPRIIFVCCFCGESEPEAEKGLALVDPESGAFEQQWWCHVACLLERMDARARSAYELIEHEIERCDYKTEAKHWVQTLYADADGLVQCLLEKGHKEQHLLP